MLEIINLSFSYPSTKVLENITFHINNNEIFAILGKNAAGKTTLVRLLTGQLTPEKGIVRIGEEYITALNSSKHFGVMYELTELYQKMKAYEYLHMVGVFMGLSGDESEKRVLSLARRFEFQDFLYTDIKKCSLGTKKKISFCAAIIHEPKFVVLDEPFNSLDPLVCYEMKQYLKRYAVEKGTVIITSHELELIQNFCTKYIIIHNRGIAASGTIDKDMQSLEKIFVNTVKEDGKE